MANTKEESLKFKLAQALKIPESDIDDSLLQVYHLLYLVNVKVERHHKIVQDFDTKWTRFFKYFYVGIIVFFAVFLATFYYTVFHKSVVSSKSDAIENLIMYDDSTKQYRIDVKNYSVQNDKNFKGIILKESK